MLRTTGPASDDQATAGRGQRLSWRLAGVILTTFTLVAGSLAARALLATAWRPPATISHQTYQRPVSRVALDLGSGDLTLLPGPAGQITVERAQRGHPAIAQTWHGGTFVVRASCAAGGQFLGIGDSGCSLRYTLWIPAGTGVDVRTSSGDIDILDLAGALQLATRSGDISLSGTTGGVQVSGGSGDLAGRGLRSPAVTARLGPGDVRLAFVTTPRAVFTTTTSGDIDIAVPGGRYRTSAQAGSGDRMVDVITDPSSAAAITARSGSGDLYIHYRH